jgi:hypothetical protein
MMLYVVYVFRPSSRHQRDDVVGYGRKQTAIRFSDPKDGVFVTQDLMHDNACIAMLHLLHFYTVELQVKVSRELDRSYTHYQRSKR